MMIKVYVIDYNRKYLVLQWTNPTTGKRCTESSKCTNRRAASIKAQEKEKELNAGVVPNDGSIGWESFRERLSEDVLSGVALGTSEKVDGVLNIMELFEMPSTLSSINSQYLSRYVGWLRKEGRAETTIQSHLRHVKAIMRWAIANHYCSTMPAIPATPRASKRKVMKGRPLTDAEVTQYLKAIPEVVGVDHAKNYKFMTQGMLVSSLRLEEALLLSWDITAEFHVVVDGDRIIFRIPAWADKGNEDRVFPTTPDCWELLLSVPKSKRSGLVFSPTYTNHRNGNVERYKNSSDVSRVFSAIGEKAKIVVDTKSGKSASAHDLRRTFGNRWAKLGTPPFLLKELMRHASITTTELYYLEQNADQTQDQIAKLWERAKEHNTQHNSSGRPAKKTRKST